MGLFLHPLSYLCEKLCDLCVESGLATFHAEDAEKPQRSLSLFFIFSQFFEHRQIFECGDVARNLAAGGDLAEQASHYLAGTRFWQSVGKADVVWLSESADLFGNVGTKLVFQVIAAGASAFERAKGRDR